MDKEKYLNTYSVDETENVVKSVGYINAIRPMLEVEIQLFMPKRLKNWIKPKG